MQNDKKQENKLCRKVGLPACSRAFHYLGECLTGGLPPSENVRYQKVKSEARSWQPRNEVKFSTELKNIKAQIEIMGLAIIIILIILAILFSLQFLPQNKISERAIQDSLIANMFVNTLLETTIKDCNIKLKELIKDCAQGNSLLCAHGSTTCQKSKDIITQLTNTYFEKAKRSYNLFIQGNPDINTLTIRAECKGERESSKPFIIPSRAGTSITVRLEVCS